MSKIDFYSHLASQPCRAVQIFMKMNNIPFNYHHIDLAKEEQKSEAYLKINPFGKVPAIKDGDFVVAESMAILEYLAAKFSTADHWYPKDAAARAKINEYLCWHHANTRESATGVCVQVAIEPAIRKQPRNEEAIKAFKTKLSATLDMIENYFLKGTSFISSNEISIADLLALNEFTELDGIGIDVGKNRPNIKAWKERVTAKIGSHYDESHEVLNAFMKQLNLATESFE